MSIDSSRRDKSATSLCEHGAGCDVSLYSSGWEVDDWSIVCKFQSMSLRFEEEGGDNASRRLSIRRTPKMEDKPEKVNQKK
jgi:hypothetical protein